MCVAVWVGVAVLVGVFCGVKVGVEDVPGRKVGVLVGTGVWTGGWVVVGVGVGVSVVTEKMVGVGLLFGISEGVGLVTGPYTGVSVGVRRVAEVGKVGVWVDVPEVVVATRDPRGVTVGTGVCRPSWRVAMRAGMRVGSCSSMISLIKFRRTAGRRKLRGSAL